MDNLIKDIIYSSIKNLFQNQWEIFENTDQTNFTEWNLSHHLSNEISKYIFWLNVDIDVTKRNYLNKRPDIIFHRRKSNALNFLVVELKKSRNDSESDIDKIKKDWMIEPLSYRYGVYINIWGLGKYKAILFEGEEKQYEINESCNYIQALNVKNRELMECKKLTDEIVFINNEVNLKQSIDLIDNLILDIYKKIWPLKNNELY
ncbi:hypothetical protein CON15_23110 [Bacillus cereus]|uniref:hypothetical protein n=1 Tax=Bacillus cereus TaxID=1396 RepID=UPI000BEBD957|nr:hypothetical protein [Bacillus cereus]PDZ55089.1 hypothetical protein CON15_23110 [Bacillus cereus]PET98223.1 hypothetical protein CN531_30690 [Bacillus cereus]PEW62962.1 hypothetical protein CN443_09670 [Bacillus cereus]PEX34190.1 hypothetical protein CN459_07215 [Bacillus cereus]PEY21295.1 hypothetical protein CN331_09955 [Bacillus cereus]